MKKPFFSAYDDRFDCDPADCSDFSTESATDNRIPDNNFTSPDFGIDKSSETATDFESDGCCCPRCEDTANNSETASDFESDGCCCPRCEDTANNSETATDFESDGCDCPCRKCTPDDESAATTDHEYEASATDMNGENPESYDYRIENTTKDSGAQNSADTEMPENSDAEFGTDVAPEFGVGVGATTEFTGIPGYPESPVPGGDSIGNMDEKTFEHGGNCLGSDETAATTDDLYTTDNGTCCMLSDTEIISDVLGSEKQLVKLYSTALCESAEEPLRDVIRANLTECAADQYATFEYMEKRGLYPTEEADEQKIAQAKQQFGPLCRS